ncbi:hypothetical protein EYF80_025250 [Liparis tanakae]|uniref:Uncharacterized protein n=1 Tax=Liparis tanakae TaxID=230148 RepID=A0A4Z2HI35_9TELE|nr:hypothetical protein EYF80_025250 [Liparis tanakae]
MQLVHGAALLAPQSKMHRLKLTSRRLATDVQKDKKTKVAAGGIDPLVLKGGRDADLAHGGHVFDTPAIVGLVYYYNIRHSMATGPEK